MFKLKSRIVYSRFIPMITYIQKKRERDIYEFCAAYRNMPEYRMVEISETDLWKEADNFWFNNSFFGYR